MLKSFSTLQPDSIAPSLHGDCDKPFGLGLFIMVTKVCKNCKKDKVLKDFDRSSGCLNGVAATCKVCKKSNGGFAPNDTTNIDGEYWVDVKTWEGLYMVSNKSRFKRMGRTFYDKIGRKQNLKEKIIKPVICTTTGYEMADLVSLDRLERTTVHRLLGIAFIDNPQNKPEINHINGIRNDNSLINLEWATSSEQKLHAFRILKRTRSKAYSKNPHLIENRKGELAPNARKVKQIDINTGEVINIFNCAKYAVDNNVAKWTSNVIKCCKGKKKSHNNFKWEYV